MEIYSLDPENSGIVVIDSKSGSRSQKLKAVAQYFLILFGIFGVVVFIFLAKIRPEEEMLKQKVEICLTKPCINSGITIK
jgi:hypothetical protein